jgi:hypothetical protein
VGEQTGGEKLAAGSQIVFSREQTGYHYNHTENEKKMRPAPGIKFI